MLIYKYQRPYGLVAQVSIKGDLPEGYEASVEVAVPGVGAYWEIMDSEEEVIANGFESSARKAYFAIHQASQALWVSGLLPVIKGRQGHRYSAVRPCDSSQSPSPLLHGVGWGFLRFGLSQKGASHAHDPSLTLSEVLLGIQLGETHATEDSVLGRIAHREDQAGTMQ